MMNGVRTSNDLFHKLAVTTGLKLRVGDSGVLEKIYGRPRERHNKIHV